jgi:hypothetical protein
MFPSIGDKKKSGPIHVDGVPQGLAHGANEAAQRVSDAIEKAGSRAVKTANIAADRAGELGMRAENLGAELGNRIGNAHVEVKAPKLRRRRHPRLRSKRRRPAPLGGRLQYPEEAMLKAQLAKTSRELAHESADLGKAVESLNSVIRANRRAGAARRTRLFLGAAAGAALMYHLDPEHGRERRAATARAFRKRA